MIESTMLVPTNQYYYAISSGNQGIESIMRFARKSGKVIERLSEHISYLEMRKRMNPHRSVRIYVYCTDKKIDEKTIDTEFLNQCKEIK